MRKVFARDFGINKDEIEEAIESYVLFTHLTEIKEKVFVVKDDPDDNKIIECAIAGNANYIVTQDKHLLRIKEFEGIEIINSNGFLKILK